MRWTRTAARAVFLVAEDPAARELSRSRIFGVSREMLAFLAGASSEAYRGARMREAVDEDDPWDVLRWVLMQRHARAHRDYASASVPRKAELFSMADAEARRAVAEIRGILAGFGL